ncbi:hypothetical protein RAV15_004496, partial [Salmonella enterica]|nr:hypothetical protein [Salmonella enterica]
FTLDTKAPEVHESSVPQGATNDTAPEFEGTGEAGATVNVTLTDSHSSSYTQSVMVNTDGSWSLKWDSTKDALQDGDYTWKVTSSDVAGNESTPPLTGSFTLDTKAPEVHESSVPLSSVSTFSSSIPMLSTTLIHEGHTSDHDSNGSYI